MPTKQPCPTCGTPLPEAEGAWDSLCPSCLLGLAVDDGRADAVTVDAAAPGGGARRPGLPIGKVQLDRYLVIEELGSGGEASVYRVRDLKLDRDVAFKLLYLGRRDGQTGDGESEDVASCLAEARLLARMSHPNIVPVHDAGELHGRPFLTMELVDGCPLSDVLDAEGPLSLRRALAIMRQVCEALQHAHQHGVLHRDVKPANILVREGDRVLLVDFGMASPRRELEGVPAREIRGTVRYIAPELWTASPPTVRSDVFAAGATLYVMLTGSPAFEGDTPAEVIDALRECEPPPAESLRPGLPKGVGKVLARALAKHPEDRPASAAALAAALEKLERGPGRRRLAWAMTAALVLTASWASWSHLNRPLTIEARIAAETRAPGGEQQVVDVHPSTVLRSGDSFWVADLQASRDAHVYVLLLNSQGELSLLFPVEEGRLPLTNGEVHQLPSRERAWQLDARAGTETVFVVASADDLMRRGLDWLRDDGDLMPRLLASTEAQRRGVTGEVLRTLDAPERARVVEAFFRERVPVVQAHPFQHE